MTCIAGVVDSGKVYLGGDSAGVAGYDLTVRADQRVFITGEFVLGFTTSFRMGQLLRYSFSPPKPHEGDEPEAFMTTDFIGAVRECLKTGGFATKTSEREKGGTFLVGFRGGLYVIEDDYQVGIPADGYHAVGCGDLIAQGSLFSTKGQPPEERIKIALEAAERHSAGVRGPFVIKSTPDKGRK